MVDLIGETAPALAEFGMPSLCAYVCLRHSFILTASHQFGVLSFSVDSSDIARWGALLQAIAADIARWGALLQAIAADIARWGALLQAIAADIARWGALLQAIVAEIACLGALLQANSKGQPFSSNLPRSARICSASRTKSAA